MSKKKNNKPMIALIALLVTVIFIALVWGAASMLTSPPKDYMSVDNVTAFADDDMPSSIAVYYEWSSSMKGFGADKDESRLNSVAEQIVRIANETGCEPALKVFTDGEPGGIKSLGAAEAVESADNQLVQMTENKSDSDLNIFITDFTEQSGTAGNISSALSKMIFDSENNCMAVMGVTSAYNGDILTGGGSYYSDKDRPFYVLICGQNTKVSYFVGELLNTTKIKSLRENGELNCEIIADKCGVAGINYNAIKLFEGNETETSLAKDFENRCKKGSVEYSEMERIRANLNFFEKQKAIKLVYPDGADKKAKYQPKLSYAAKTENAVPGKLKLSVPFVTLHGVNMQTMLPKLQSKIYYVNSSNKFVEYQNNEKAVSAELEFERLNFYEYALKMLDNNMSLTDIVREIKIRVNYLKEDEILTSELLEESTQTIEILETYPSAEDCKNLLTELNQTKEYSKDRSFALDPLIAANGENRNSLVVNTMFRDIKKLVPDAKAKMLKIEYTITDEYNSGALPLWITMQSTSVKADVANGKIFGLYDVFEGLYSYLQKNSKTQNTFTVYISPK